MQTEIIISENNADLQSGKVIISNIANELRSLGINQQLASQLGNISQSLFESRDTFNIGIFTRESEVYYSGKGKYLPISWNGYELWVYLKGSGSIKLQGKNLKNYGSLDPSLSGFPQTPSEMLFDSILPGETPRVTGAMSIQEEGVMEYINSLTAFVDYCEQTGTKNLEEIFDREDYPVIPLFLVRDDKLSNHLNTVIEMAIAEAGSRKSTYLQEDVATLRELMGDFGVVAQIVPCPERFTSNGRAENPKEFLPEIISGVANTYKSELEKGQSHISSSFHLGNFYKINAQSADYTDKWYMSDFSKAKSRYQLRKAIGRMGGVMPFTVNEDTPKAYSLFLETVLEGYVQPSVKEHLWWLNTFMSEEFLHAASTILSDSNYIARTIQIGHNRDKISANYTYYVQNPDRDNYLKELKDDSFAMLFDQTSRSLVASIKNFLISGDLEYISENPFLGAAFKTSKLPFFSLEMLQLILKPDRYFNSTLSTNIIRRRLRNSMFRVLSTSTDEKEALEIIKDHKEQMPLFLAISKIQYHDPYSKEPALLAWEYLELNPSTIFVELGRSLTSTMNKESRIQKYFEAWNELNKKGHEQERAASLTISDYILSSSETSAFSDFCHQHRIDHDTFIAELREKHNEAYSILVQTLSTSS